MKRTKEIKLNGKDYTLELNRESFVQIDKICNIKKLMAKISANPYEYIDEIDDNYNPFENTPSIEDIQKLEEEKTQGIKMLCERAFFIWLYPNYKFKISEVQEMLKPYFEDIDKFSGLEDLFYEILDECVAIKDDNSKN